MLFRFSLYGFLKNQQYFEPFLFLALRQKGLSFFLIGVLIGLREIFINLFEIPSGVAADVYGRKKSMIFSFSAYICSFVIFSFSSVFWHIIVAMFFFALGEAFRSGTHKAMIFAWLKRENRKDDKTRVYGFTRSWSKIGSAVSAIIAGLLVFYSKDYSIVFLFSTIPYIICIINFLSYPTYLDKSTNSEISFKYFLKSFTNVFKISFKKKTLRNIMIESMCFEGYYKTSKDYLQPIIKNLALSMPFFMIYSSKQRTAFIMAIVYFVLFVLSGIASRLSHRFSNMFNSDHKRTFSLWLLNLLCFVFIGIFVYLEKYMISAFMFIITIIIQNIWKPILINRIEKNSDETYSASVLSVDSQAKSFFTMAFAPLIGYAVDNVGLWVIGPIGVLVTISVLAFKYLYADKLRKP